MQPKIALLLKNYFWLIDILYLITSEGLEPCSRFVNDGFFDKLWQGFSRNYLN